MTLTDETAPGWPGGPATLARPPMVGRQVEMNALAVAARRARHGQGSFFCISGEPGIGKSRLVQEWLSSLATSGSPVCVGNCHPGESVMAYRPWLEVLGSITTDGHAEGAHANGFGSFLPGLSTEMDLSDPAEDDDLQRLRLFDRAFALLREVSASRPVLIVLEDVHWADAASIRLARHVARRVARLGVVLVVTYRDSEAAESPLLPELLEETRERRLGQFLPLKGLDLAGTRTLAEECGLRADEQGFAVLFEKTSGNPYFVEELARHKGEAATSSAALTTTDELPPPLFAIISHRVGQRSAECVSVLQAAAVLGREFKISLLAEMMRRELVSLESVLAEASRAHFVELVPGEPDDGRFVHALVQQALMEGLSKAAAETLHLKAAETIERIAPPGEPGKAARLARHYRLAHSRAAVPKLIAAATETIKTAADSCAWDEARETFELSLAEVDSLGATDLQRAAFIAAVISGPFPRLGLSANWLAETAEPAAEILLAEGRKELAAGLLSAVFWACIAEDSFEALNPAKALQLPERILSLTNNEYTRAQCDGNLPMLLLLLGRLEDAKTAAEALLESRHPTARAGALIYIANCLLYNGAIDEARVSYETGWVATTLTSPVEAPAIVAQGAKACRSASGAWWRIRAPSRQGTLIERELALHRQPSKPRRQLEIFLAAACADQGVTAESSKELRRRQPLAEGWTGVSLDHIEFREGNWLVASKSLRKACGLIHPDAFDDIAILSELLADCSRHVDPQGAAGIVSAGQLESPVALRNVAANALTGLIAAELGNYDELRTCVSRARGAMTDDDWLGLGARVELLEAIIALVDGCEDEAVRLFDSATKNMRRVQHPWDESDAHYVFGKVLIQLSRSADALPHFDSALTILHRIKASQPFFERVLSQRRTTGAADPTSSVAAATVVRVNGSSGMSPRELEVLALVATGRSNREIAATLVISEPTVATHVRHILDKTGTANRTEAAAFAIRNELH
ncbi:MAG: AAA family ATPase [bacterium]